MLGLTLVVLRRHGVGLIDNPLSSLKSVDLVTHRLDDTRGLDTWSKGQVGRTAVIISAAE